MSFVTSRFLNLSMVYPKYELQIITSELSKTALKRVPPGFIPESTKWNYPLINIVHKPVVLYAHRLDFSFNWKLVEVKTAS